MASVWAASLDQVDPQDIWRKDRDHFLHPWTHFDSFRKDGSLVMSRAEGAYVYDVSGKRYLDGIGGLWCVNMGYGREEIIEAMADQARRLVYFSPFVDTTNVPAAELAAKLAELAPGALNHVFFTCGGSTANDTAVRLIQYYYTRRSQPASLLHYRLGASRLGAERLSPSQGHERIGVLRSSGERAGRQGPGA